MESPCYILNERSKNKTMKNLLITGGAGFIGSNFIKYILKNYPNYRIVNFDLLTYAGNLNNLKEEKDNPNYIFVQGDIREKENLENLFKEYTFNYIVNFAAESHVDRSINNPAIFAKTNTLGTQILLDAAKTHWQKRKDEQGYPIYRKEVRFIQISTDEVYGELDSEEYFNENSPLKPSSPYSASKASADFFANSYYDTFKLPLNITRCSNNYGPYQFPEKLIPLMITNALQNKKLPVFGDGMQIRDWLHVQDHCKALDLILHEGKSGEVYNIGGNNEITNIELIKTILDKLNKSKELIEHVRDRLNHDRRYAIDNSKIASELGWKPKFSLQTGIDQTINWYLNNKDWWKKIKNGKYQKYYQKMYENR